MIPSGAWAQVPFGRECMLVCLKTRNSSIACTPLTLPTDSREQLTVWLPTGCVHLEKPQDAAAGHMAILKLWLLSSMNKY